MDVNVSRALTNGVRRLGVEVLTAQEDESRRLTDDSMLKRAAELGRVLFTQDQDFFTLTYELLAQGTQCPGVIYAHQKRPIGDCIQELQLIAELMEPEELANRCLKLPL